MRHARQFAPIHVPAFFQGLARWALDQIPQREVPGAAVPRRTKRAGPAQGKVALVGAGPGAKDLITLRGVQRLQDADVIFYDRLIDPEILQLANPDAECIFVGKAPGCHSWPQDRITQALLQAAQNGLRVVRLKCGDPGIFARSCDEIAALKEAQIPFEIVPGVTSACAAAAASGEPLTERGEIDTVILSTGHLAAGTQVPDCVKALGRGMSVSLYMGVSSAWVLADYFSGKPEEKLIEVMVVANAQTAREIIFHCDLQSLPLALANRGIKHTAMIVLKWRKSGNVSAVQPLEVSS